MDLALTLQLLVPVLSPTSNPPPATSSLSGSPSSWVCSPSPPRQLHFGGRADGYLGALKKGVVAGCCTSENLGAGGSVLGLRL